MLKPLEQFYCDTCDELIEKPEHGWFEWIKERDDEGNLINYNFRICHHKRDCQELIKHPHVADIPLSDFIKERGIIRLLNFIDMGKTIINDSNYEGPMIKNYREFVEVFRRLTLPYYEEARRYWDIADSNGDHYGVNEVALYVPDRLKKIIEEYADE